MSSFWSVYNRVITCVFYAYMVSVAASMAGMELFGWLLFVLALPLMVKGVLETKSFDGLKLGKDYYLWGFWLVMIVSAILNENLSVENKQFIAADGRWILLLYSFSYLLKNQIKFEKKQLLVFVCICAAVGLYAIYQTFSGNDLLRAGGMGDGHRVGDYWRGRGFFGSTMTYSYSFGMFFCLFFASFLKKIYQQKSKNIFLIASIIVGLSLVLTFTRGLWIALFLAVLAMLYLYNKKLCYRVLGSSVIVLLLGVFTIPTVRERISSIGDVKNSSNVGRFQVWQANWEMIKDYPLLGVGHRMNQATTKQYYEKMGIKNGFIGHSHNNFIEVMGGTGLIGLIFYLLFNWTFFITALSLWRKSTAAWGMALGLGSVGAQICLHVGGMTQVNFMDGEVNHAFVFLMAITIAASVKLKRQQEHG